MTLTHGHRHACRVSSSFQNPMSSRISSSRQNQPGFVQRFSSSKNEDQMSPFKSRNSAKDYISENPDISKILSDLYDRYDEKPLSSEKKGKSSLSLNFT